MENLPDAMKSLPNLSNEIEPSYSELQMHASATAEVLSSTFISDESLALPETPPRRTLEGASSRPQDLPMMLWMRGDEDWAADFSIDADNAMKILGIKRSRLTQLTGKELRVARKRVERYIKPFYRRSDLEEYLETARASLTVQKSSETLEKASHLLEEKAENIETTLRNELSKTIAQVGDRLNETQGFFQQSLEQLREDFQKKHQSLQVFFESMSQNTFEEFKSLHSLSHAGLLGLKDEHSKLTESVLSSFQSVQASNLKHHESVVTGIAKNSTLMAESIVTYENKIQDLAKILSLLLQYTRDLSQKMQTLAVQNEKQDSHKQFRVQRISKFKHVL